MANDEASGHDVYVEGGEVHERQENVDESVMRRAVAGGGIGNAEC